VLRERLVRVSDDPTVELFVAEVGEPGHRPLLVIHGGPDWDHTYLREPLVRLRNDRRVVFVDLRGCGRSTRGLSAGAYTPDAAMRDVVVLLDEIADQPVDVLGFSYGGMLVQRLALMVPERVRRIVIASSSVLPVPPDAFDGWLDRDQRLAAQPSVESCDGDAPDVDHTRLDAVSSANANVWQLELLPEYLARLDQVHFSADWTASWLADDLPPARPEAAAERLAALGKPILLLHGRQDMTFPVSLVRPTTQRIPTARAVIIDNAGHMTHVDQPGQWLAAIRDFLIDSAD
jgi:pimeloyl-ACP methyl ester carboxylesterase